MPIANIIGLSIIGAIVLMVLVMIIRLKAWGDGYSEGFKDCQKLTESYVNELMKAGEDIDIPNGSSKESTN
jgi:hypothetical protein